MLIVEIEPHFVKPVPLLEISSFTLKFVHLRMYVLSPSVKKKKVLNLTRPAFFVLLLSFA